MGPEVDAAITQCLFSGPIPMSVYGAEPTFADSAGLGLAHR